LNILYKGTALAAGLLMMFKVLDIYEATILMKGVIKKNAPAI